MAFKHGKNAEAWLDALEIEGFLNSIDTKADTDTSDSTTFKKDWKTNTVGASQGSVEMAGFYDPAFTALESSLDVEAGAVLTVGPAGMEAVADMARLVKVKKVSYAESSPVGGTIAFKSSVMADGPVGYGVVLHPMVAVSTSSSGTAHVGPVGGTANGAVAHLHVKSVSAGDTLDVTVQDSANNTDWLTIGTFVQKTAAGVERIEIAGTVRRYVRLNWAVTGAAVSIEFGAALARL